MSRDETAFVGLDWGTSSLRAYRIGLDGRILQRRATRRGILSVPAGGFESVFADLTSDWLGGGESKIPVVASGMIGSRQGWVEVPYVTCPASLSDLGEGLVHHRTGSGARVHFVPGLSVRNEDGVPDVMRGEETQIFGAVDASASTRLVVLPGTHSKWARIENARVTWFASFMTGELFAVLTEHSILGRLMRGDQHDPAAFSRGLAYAANTGLLGKLFSARTLGLFDELPGECLNAYLSGLLIGAEITEALAGSGHVDEVTVVGSNELARRYVLALCKRGITATAAPEDIVAKGQWRLALAAGLVPGTAASAQGG